MKNIIFLIFALTAFGISGCGRLNLASPELKNEIDNQNGEIDEILNNQNGMATDILNLKQETDLITRDLKNFQQGYVNYSKTNDGIQILQGDGALILIFSIFIFSAMLIFHYKSKANKNEKMAKMLSYTMMNVNQNRWKKSLVDQTLHTGLEKEMFDLLEKSKIKHRNLG